ncbi:MAG: hypothetical protein E7358_04990 [Clostridiales bacterium]|nr:hypothetical protein [Clostridiales bacterium]
MIAEDKKREYVRRLILSRMRLLNTNGFYGLLLMHAEFSLDFVIETAATDGTRIYFSPKFMDDLSDSELDFVLMHEVMHMALYHCLRTGNRDPRLFNIACDIVVNSNILHSNNGDKNSITLQKYGESMNLAPDGKDGYNYTAEEVYEMLLDNENKKVKQSAGGQSNNNKKGGSRNKTMGEGGDWDDHGKWKDSVEGDFNEDENKEKAKWQNRLKNAAEAIEIRSASTSRGTVPILAKRLIKELTEPQTDWREILSTFIQEEVVDYSFSPPDKRYGDSPFFLPDFNDTDVIIKDVLFMIDTSGSMSDELITLAYSEVKGALDQFDNKLNGMLGFFDADVVPPVPFCDEESLLSIKVSGGGGTDFAPIFSYVKNEMPDNLPSIIIILTDGYAPFPDESCSLGIPVLWLLNNESVTPPWGRIARIKAPIKD